MHHGRAHEVGVVGHERAGQPADGSGDGECDQPIDEGGKPDRLHPAFVRARSLEHHAEARIR